MLHTRIECSVYKKHCVHLEWANDVVLNTSVAIHRGSLSHMHISINVDFNVEIGAIIVVVVVIIMSGFVFMYCCISIQPIGEHTLCSPSHVYRAAAEAHSRSPAFTKGIEECCYGVVILKYESCSDQYFDGECYIGWSCDNNSRTKTKNISLSEVKLKQSFGMDHLLVSVRSWLGCLQRPMRSLETSTRNKRLSVFECHTPWICYSSTSTRAIWPRCESERRSTIWAVLSAQNTGRRHRPYVLQWRTTLEGCRISKETGDIVLCLSHF